MWAGAARAGGSILAGAIAQPQVRWVDDYDNGRVTNPENSGFVLRHARAYGVGSYQGQKVLWEARIEIEMVPFQLLDAYGAASADLPKGGFWKIWLGQHFAPFSRQTILSIGDLQFSNQAQLTTLTPNRQLGLSAMLAIPGAPWLQVTAGFYNGKGINVVENIDSNFMYVGRIAFRPIAPRAPLLEAALGPDALWIAANTSYNQQKLGDFNQYQLLIGGDAFWSFRGFSAYAEYLWGDTTYSTNAPKKPFHLQGANVQAGYLLPIPGILYRRFEIAFRFEAVAPNQTVPITGPGDPNQARASYVFGIGYYHRGHNLKFQANYFRNQELDTTTADGRSAQYRNDQLLLQMTYRLE